MYGVCIGEERKGSGNVLGVFTRRTDNGNALGHHDLVPTMRVQVATTHETRLRRMRVDPAQYHQVLAVAVVEQRALVHRLARIGRAFLLRDHQLRDE